MKWLIKISAILLMFSCKKSNLNNDDFHLTLKFNGSRKAVVACGSSYYYAQYLGDTTLLISFGCASNRIGFLLRGNNKDGTYILDQHNSGNYSDDSTNTFNSDSLHKGTITFATERANGIIKIRGTFQFNGFDSVTRNRCVITDGEFLLLKD